MLIETEIGTERIMYAKINEYQYFAESINILFRIELITYQVFLLWISIFNKIFYISFSDAEKKTDLRFFERFNLLGCHL